MFKKEVSSISSYTADIMSGLMIIFLFISVSYMIEVGKEKQIAVKQKNIAEQEKQNIKNIAKQFKEIKYSIYDDLNQEFKKDLKRWNAEIDKETLSIKFKEPDVFFKVGKADLNDNFKKILNDFFPRYVKILSKKKYKNNIEEIRIEGHTSSEWTRRDTGLTLESYFKNMELSQDRTRSVLEYVMQLNSMNNHRMFLINKLTANGLSYSKRIILKNGEEDYKKSRRVEFRIRTTAEKHIERILNGDKNEGN